VIPCGSRSFSLRTASDSFCCSASTLISPIPAARSACG